MMFPTSAKVGRGDLQVTTVVPDPENEGEVKDALLTIDAVVVKFNLGAAGDFEVGLDPELCEKIADAMKRTVSSGIVPATMADVPKAPFGVRDGVPQSS